MSSKIVGEEINMFLRAKRNVSQCYNYWEICPINPIFFRNGSGGYLIDVALWSDHLMWPHRQSVVIQILDLLELLLFCSWIPRRIEYNSYVSYEFSYLFFLKNRVTTMRESLASKPVISSLLRNVGSFFFKKDDSRCGLTSQNLPEFQARDHLT